MNVTTLLTVPRQSMKKRQMKNMRWKKSVQSPRSANQARAWLGKDFDPTWAWTVNPSLRL